MDGTRRKPLQVFRTHQDQLFVAWTQEQFNRAIRLNWVALWGEDQ